MQKFSEMSFIFSLLLVNFYLTEPDSFGLIHMGKESFQFTVSFSLGIVKYLRNFSVYESTIHKFG